LITVSLCVFAPFCPPTWLYLYLTPHPFRGRRNELKHVALVAAKLAELRGLPVEQIAEITANNDRTLFGLNVGTTGEVRLLWEVSARLTRDL
jgi:hypothetical protein